MSINPYSQLYAGGMGQQNYAPQGYAQQDYSQLGIQSIPPAISALLQQLRPQADPSSILSQAMYPPAQQYPSMPSYPQSPAMTQYPPASPYPQMPQYPSYPNTSQYHNQPTGIPKCGGGGYGGGYGNGGIQSQLSQIIQLLTSLLGGGYQAGGYPQTPPPVNYAPF